MHDMNAVVAWGAMLTGATSGAALGLRFHREQWLGGYDSWKRRMLRLGHIAFFGVAFLNLALAVSASSLHWPIGTSASVALAAANGLMPAACFLAAWRKPLRHLVVLPAGLILFALADVLCWRLMS
jgi:hypothetical protein